MKVDFCCLRYGVSKSHMISLLNGSASRSKHLLIPRKGLSLHRRQYRKYDQKRESRRTCSVQRFWINTFTSCHKLIAEQYTALINREEKMPRWLIKLQMMLLLENASNGNSADNYRQISYLSLIWKLLSGGNSDLYKFLDKNDMLLTEEISCRRRCRSAKDQLLIEKMVIQNFKRRSKNLEMTWIDYCNAYDIFPLKWITEYLDLFGTAKHIMNFLKKIWWGGKLNWHLMEEAWVPWVSRRGIFQDDIILIAFCSLHDTPDHHISEI